MVLSKRPTHIHSRGSPNVLTQTLDNGESNGKEMENEMETGVI